MLKLHKPLNLQTLPDHMVKVEAGTFEMGDDTKRKVTLTQDFLLCRYPVTQALWMEIIGHNPSVFKGSQRPVERVSWYDAVEFCNILSQKMGLFPAYHIDKETQDLNNYSSFDNIKWTVRLIPHSNGYRLPTEAEWEYAAKGGRYGKGFAYTGGPDLDYLGWYGPNSQGETQPVGTKMPNELGLYNLLGNVFEWCWDWCANDTGEANIDPTGPEIGSLRVLRGGSWRSVASFCRVADRGYFDTPSDKDLDYSFRLAKYV